MSEIIFKPDSDSHDPVILVVDDEVSIVNIIESFLEMEGFSPVCFTDSSEAMNWLEHNRVDLVLTDLRMDHFSGEDIFHQTQKTQRDPIVIIMTAYPTLSNVIEVLRMGVYDYLLKPFGMDSLLVTIKRGLEKQKLSREVVQLNKAVSLYQVSEALGSTIEFQELLKIIMQTALTEADAQEVSLILFEPQLSQLKLEASIGLPLIVQKNGYQSREGSVVEWVINNNEPLMLNGSLKGTPFSSVAEGRIIHSSLCIPIRAKGKVLGALSVNRTARHDPFTLSQLQALSIITSNAAQAIENARLYDGLYRDYMSTINALAKAVEAKDPYTQGHSSRVVQYSLAIAREIGIPEEDWDTLKVASILHDIGKIGIPDNILLKSGKLTDEEYDFMKKHPVIGDQILAPIQSLEKVRRVIYQHHERVDGLGYPDGVKGADLNPLSRILIVGEVFDALATKRSYKEAWNLDKIVEFFREKSGSQFDPDVVNAMTNILSREGEKFIDMSIPEITGLLNL